MNKKCPYDIKSQSLSSLLDTLWYGIKLKELLEDTPFIFVATSSLHIKILMQGGNFLWLFVYRIRSLNTKVHYCFIVTALAF